MSGGMEIKKNLSEPGFGGFMGWVGWHKYANPHALRCILAPVLSLLIRKHLYSKTVTG